MVATTYSHSFRMNITNITLTKFNDVYVLEYLTLCRLAETTTTFVEAARIHERT